MDEETRPHVAKSRQIRYTSDEEVRDALLEFIIFICFLILSTVVALSVRHSYMFYFNNTMERLFVDRDISIAPSVSVNFIKLVTVEDFWDYLQYAFLATLHGATVFIIGQENYTNVLDEKEAIPDGNVKPPKGDKQKPNEFVGDDFYENDDDRIKREVNDNGFMEFDELEDDDRNDDRDDDTDDEFFYKRNYNERVKRAKGPGGSSHNTGSAKDRFRVGTNGSTSNLYGRIFLQENVLLGPPRVRQIRVKKDTCYVNDAFIRYFNTCYAEYSAGDEDQQKEYKGTPFRTKSEIEAESIWAQLSLYHGAGYVEDLTYDLEKNKEKISKLRDEKWIDRGSRIVLIEFNLYNENTDIFQMVKLIAELPPTGGVLPSAQLRTVKEYSFFTEPNIGITIATILFYVMVLYYTYQEIMELRKIGCRRYISIIQNYLDALILLLAYFALAYNIWHLFEIKRLENRYTGEEVFISLDTICLVNFIYIDMVAILAFLVWIKIFKFISFNKTLVQFTTTLRRCSKDLAGFSLMFLIVFLAYAQLGLLLFGTKHPDFKNFITSVLTMIRMILGDFQYELIEKANRILGPIYFLTYILLVFFILLNMFLAIIMETYNSVKSEITVGRSQLGSYLYKKIVQAYRFVRNCGRRRRDRQTGITHVDDSMPQEQSIKVRKATQPHDKYLDDAPPETSNKELHRLNNRVALLEEVLEQLVTNMDNILKRVEQEKSAAKKKK